MEPIRFFDPVLHANPQEIRLHPVHIAEEPHTCNLEKADPLKSVTENAPRASIPVEEAAAYCEAHPDLTKKVMNLASKLMLRGPGKGRECKQKCETECWKEAVRKVDRMENWDTFPLSL